VELGRIWQNAVDCRWIAVRLPFCSWSLIAESVETGGRVQGVMGVSRDNTHLPISTNLVTKDRL